jgi:uncharacterized membrane protein YcaP (DUF421 family)
MGKRQLAEMQPYELVVTVLISEIASKPIQNIENPLLTAIFSVLILVCLEVIISYISIYNIKIRTLISGQATPIIINGTIDQKILAKMRLSVEDIASSLRQKDIFNISDVDFALIETNGKLSIYEKSSNQINKAQKDINPQLIIIDNGNLISNNLKTLGHDVIWLDKILKKEKQNIEKIFIMTCNSNNNYYIVPKD